MEGKHLFLKQTELTGHCPNFVDFEKKVAIFSVNKSKKSSNPRIETMVNNKLDFTEVERADMKRKYLDYPEWVEYKVGNKHGKMTVLKAQDVSNV